MSRKSCFGHKNRLSSGLGERSIVENVGGQQEGETQSIRQVIAASFIGTTIEWYDSFLYGSAAARLRIFNAWSDRAIVRWAAQRR
jgi:hypothetical protein